ncbi:TolC family protein [Sphingobacterium sp. E70]|uniref:TolC family protein n=1 Tax=Sphingobacterium sp. E70 TaxID=2853439 RepID=UPI00211D064A|nr:TolC family protein [Sphingobacterium sp. E70]ULT22758.1 TolC family protein [Sphingobacterium sp. E70]
MSLDKMFDLALENNADYQFALKTAESSQLFTKWQKSLNTPDINLGLEYSQNGGTFHNELNLKAAIPLPLWKQNKGNIIKAKYAEEEAKKNIEVQRQLLESQIRSNYQSWENQYNQYFTITADDLHNIAVVYDGVFSNFRKGNISLVEFTDFMDSYRISILKLYDMKKKLSSMPSSLTTWRKPLYSIQAMSIKQLLLSTVAIVFLYACQNHKETDNSAIVKGFEISETMLKSTSFATVKKKM